MRKIVFLLFAGIVLIAGAGCTASRSYQQGERFSQRGEWDMAVKEYRLANQRSPQNIEYRSALIRAEETAANHHYKKARNYVKERKLDQAVNELQLAVFLNPTNAAIQSALKAVLDMKQAEEHYRASLTFTDLGRLGEAQSELNRSVDLDPENAKYHEALDKLQKKRDAEPEDALTLSSDKPITLNFKNTNVKEAFELLAKLSGINILFDEEVRAQPVTVFVKDVSFYQAMNLLLSTNKLFMKKISDDTIIIVPKTKAKMEQYQDLVVKTFYLNTAKSKDMVNLLRSMFEIKKIYVNEPLNSLTVRETPEKIKLIDKVIAANDLKEAEVILDVEILEISRTKSLKYGWNFTDSLTASASLQSTSTSSTGGLTLADLRNLSKDNVLLKLPGVVVNLIKQDSDAKTLANPRVRVLNNKQAKFHIGDKIPVQTSTSQATTVGTVVSTFEYKDVGIKVNVEPTVHLNNTVTLKLGLEISTLGDALEFGDGGKQFRFGTRNTDTVLNLRDGETVIIGGLIKDEERKGRIKIPILGDIPLIGKLFSSSDDGTVKTDILMSITPNIVRGLELPDREVQSFWSGTEESYDTKPLFLTSIGRTKTPEKTAILDVMAKQEPAEPQTLEAPAAVAAARLEVRPAEVVTAVGQEVRFEITADNVKDLYGAMITLSYSKDMLDFKTASEGGLLKKDGQQTSFLFSHNEKANTVDIYMTRIGDVGGVDGAGSLFTLLFQGRSKGSGSLSASGKLRNANREQMNANASGKVAVQ